MSANAELVRERAKPDPNDIFESRKYTYYSIISEGHHREPMRREARTRIHPLPAVGKSRPKAEEGHDSSRGPTPGGRKAQV